MNKKILTILSCLLLLYACKGEKTLKQSNIEILQINMNKPTKEPLSSFIEKVEVVPLETTDSCLIASFRNFSYCAELDMYIVLDKDLIVYLFSKEGKFISSSASVYGQGPGEYLTIADFCYNPYKKTIDLLDPRRGCILSYDLNFSFIEKRNLPKESVVFSELYFVDKDKYLVVPPCVAEKDAFIHLVDFNKETLNDPIHYSGVLASAHMMREPFFKAQDKFYFSPPCLHYHFYEIDIENNSLLPVAKLDFGDGEVRKEDLEKRYGSFDGPTREDYSKKEQARREMNDQLMVSNYPIPLIRFLNEKYIYAHIMQNRVQSTYIYNRQTKKSFLYTSNSSVAIPHFAGIEDNVLYTLIESWYVETYANELLTEEAKTIIKGLKEDDNPVIMRWHLKTPH